jgi:methylase of polypeptide subunit release factors
MLYQVQINKIKVFYDENINGGGRESIYDFLSVVKLLSNDNVNYKRVMEWCSGPGFPGFGLLSLLELEKLVLVDIHKPVQEYIDMTVKTNNLKCVEFINSYNFNHVPKQKFDLIIGNPPHFCIDPFNKLYDDSRKYKDENWDIHRNFFENVSDYLEDDGRIILQENCWGSGPEVFRQMIESNGLKIEHCVRSRQFSKELWYMSITKK